MKWAYNFPAAVGGVFLQSTGGLIKKAYSKNFDWFASTSKPRVQHLGRRSSKIGTRQRQAALPLGLILLYINPLLACFQIKGLGQFKAISFVEST